MTNIEVGLSLPEFLAAYIEAALWSSSDQTNDQGGEPLDRNYGPNDLSPELRERMTEDCVEFLKASGDLLTDENWLGVGSAVAAGGHDFWLTRNGHGCGFWDGDWAPEAADLDAAARGFGSHDLTVGDDGLIY